MKYELPLLPYADDALEPNMSAETIHYHYGKHFQTYLTNLNTLIEGTKYEEMPLEEIVRTAEGPLFNNAGQAWNHKMFFLELSPDPKREPGGRLAEAIRRDFGSFEQMKEKFTHAANTLFGSGWAFLSQDEGGHLIISQEPNGNNPMTKGLIPLMTCDVWEHAYYIDYKNRRAGFAGKFWEMLDWSVVESKYK